MSPVDYGATGNGSSDDTNAVQAAIDHAIEEDVGLVFPARATFLTDPLTIDAPLWVEGHGATLKLKSSANGDLLTVGADAVDVHLDGLVLDGNLNNQSGTSHGVVFDTYSGSAREADRSTLTRCTVKNFLTDGIRVQAGRIQVDMTRVSVRNVGRFGVYLGGTDCHFHRGAVGICAHGVYLDGWANWVTESGLYSTTTSACRVTEGGRYSQVWRNSIDNNEQVGVLVQGTSTDTFDLTVGGNMFRANSQDAAGAYSDIKIDNARAVLLTGNQTAKQTDRSLSKWAVELTASVQDIQGTGNRFDTVAHSSGVYNDNSRITVTA